MHLTGHGLIALIAAGFFARWLWQAVFHPFADCRRCEGTGRNRGSTRRRRGRCWRCGGKGERQVLGSAYVHKVLRTRRGTGGKKG